MRRKTKKNKWGAEDTRFWTRREATIDRSAAISGYAISMELPYAAMLPGGPSTGATSQAGRTQWVTIAFRLASPTRAKQDMQALRGAWGPPGSLSLLAGM